jgi:hypothetical protein
MIRSSHLMHGSIIINAALCTGVWLFWPASANAQSAAPDADSAAKAETGLNSPTLERHLPRYELQVQLGAWVPRLSGKVSLDNTADRLDFDEDLDLFQSEAVFNGEIYLRKDEVWEIAFGGFDFATDITVDDFASDDQFGEVSIDRGDQIRSTFDVTSFWGEIVPCAWRAYNDEQPDDPHHPAAENMTWDGRYIIDLRLMPRLGLRTLDVEQTMENLDTGEREEIEAAWLAFYGGLAAELQYRPERSTPMLDLLELELGVNAGPALGNDGGFMTEVRAGINWHFHPNAGATVGYRLVSMFVEDDDYDLDATLAGLYFAASIRF